MRRKKIKRTIILMLILIFFLFAYLIYGKHIMYKLNNSDVDYNTSYSLPSYNNNYDSNSIIITMDRNKHSGNFKNIYFGVVLNDMVDLKEINHKNYNLLDYTFYDNSKIRNYTNKNNMGLIKIEYFLKNIDNVSLNINTFHIVFKGNNNKYQYYTFIYYINNESNLIVSLLEDSDIYNYTKLEHLLMNINNDINSNITISEISKKLVSERESIKEKIL